MRPHPRCRRFVDLLVFLSANGLMERSKVNGLFAIEGGGETQGFLDLRGLQMGRVHIPEAPQFLKSSVNQSQLNYFIIFHATPLG